MSSRQVQYQKSRIEVHPNFFPLHVHDDGDVGAHYTSCVKNKDSKCTFWQSDLLVSEDVMPECWVMGDGDDGDVIVLVIKAFWP